MPSLGSAAAGDAAVQVAAEPIALMPAMPTAATTPSAPAGTSLSLDALQAMALECNPTLRQANAQIFAARGMTLQAGLPPNPVVGYVGEQIGAEGTAGETQGISLQQEFVTAGKLRLSRAKYRQTIRQGQIQRTAQELRVQNGVAIAYYHVLAADERVRLANELLRNAADGVQTAKEMLNLGQANTADLLQAQVQERQQRLFVRKAEFGRDAAWTHLVSVVGVPELPRAPLIGELAPSPHEIDWEGARARLLAESPELLIAKVEVCRDRIQLRREQVQPIPNVTLQAASGYNFESNDTIATVTAELPIPVWNRNQGTIREARGELSRACAEVQRLELDLQRRLAEIYQRYRTARVSAEEYHASILPDAKQAFELLLKSYQERRAPWPDVLLAERTYFQLSVEYLDELIELKETEVAIDGLLLTDGLMQPPAPVPGGHIDATPQPR